MKYTASICIGRATALLTFFALFSAASLLAAADAPTGLMTDLLEHTDRVWRDGLPTQLHPGELTNAIEHLQVAEIRSSKPTFSWIMNDSQPNTVQQAWEIEMATSPELLSENTPTGNKPAGKQPAGNKRTANSKGNQPKKPDLWSTGRVNGSESSSVPYGGKPLTGGMVCWWHVRTWNNRNEVSPWSEVKSFKMAKKLSEYEISRYPIVKGEDSPVKMNKIDARTTFYDFGKASFGQFVVKIKSGSKGQTAIIRLGERVAEGRVNRQPAGSTRYAEYRLALFPGEETYFIKTRVDQRNTSGAAVLMPDYIGEVMPFRYAEVELSDARAASVTTVRRDSAWYPFDETAAFFHCDNEGLNQVWDLCHWSIKATSALGIYIDGDRERIPYEGDALLNQLSHYSTDREYSLARYSQEYMIFHPTWPTEWILQSVQMAWYDYLYTGDARNIAKHYNQFRAKSLIALAEPNGLISTRKGKLTPAVLDSIHFKGKGFRDIVDWPHKGLAGNDNAASGETDGFVFNDFNVVVNSYHYFALRSMLRFAQILDKKDDVALFQRQIDLLQKSFQEVFFDSKRGVYKDGEATEHASLHGNMFPLAFGLVPEEHRKSVTKFVESRGMRCSVYGAQFLLDAAYEGENGDYGLKRMIADDLRGWLNMIKVGSTISLEAWDDRYKPNQDWNHAWGAAPANIIPRKLVGVEPLEPAFRKVRIKPQTAGLQQIEAVVPSIRGNFTVKVVTKPKFCQTVIIPANVQAEVWVPAGSEKEVITINGRPAAEAGVKPIRSGNFWRFDNIGSGKWNFE